MNDLLTEIWESIRRNKLRTALTGFAVAWGIFMLIVLLGAGNGLINAQLKQSDRFLSSSMVVFGGETSKAYQGLKDWASHYPNELSGGQKQRVAIARALITRPKIILADEPTGALDSKTSVEVMQLLKELNAREHITQIIVTHDPTVAEQTNRIIRIKDGVIE